MPRIAYVELEVDDDATAEDVEKALRDWIPLPDPGEGRLTIRRIREVDVQTRV